MQVIHQQGSICPRSALLELDPLSVLQQQHPHQTSTTSTTPTPTTSPVPTAKWGVETKNVTETTCTITFSDLPNSTENYRVDGEIRKATILHLNVAALDFPGFMSALKKQVSAHQSTNLVDLVSFQAANTNDGCNGALLKTVLTKKDLQHVILNVVDDGVESNEEALMMMSSSHKTTSSSCSSCNAAVRGVVHGLQPGTTYLQLCVVEVEQGKGTPRASVVLVQSRSYQVVRTLSRPVPGRCVKRGHEFVKLHISRPLAHVPHPLEVSESETTRITWLNEKTMMTITMIARHYRR